jgi:hypothetical protein
MEHSHSLKDSEANIREALTSYAPIELYYMTQPEGGRGLIYFFDVKESRFYVLKMKDNEFYQSCVEYLKRQNLPVFEYLDDVDEYEKEIQEKYKDSLEDFREGALDSKTASLKQGMKMKYNDGIA